jgi:hypothetical protein
VPDIEIAVRALIAAVNDKYQAVTRAESRFLSVIAEENCPAKCRWRSTKRNAANQDNHYSGNDTHWESIASFVLTAGAGRTLPDRAA